MKRLVKKAMMTPEMFEGTIEQLGEKGRAILKLIEEYKFDLEQAARIVTNNQILSQKMIQKKSEVDKAAGQIYTIVFDIENIDIVSAFEQQEQMVNNPGSAGPLDGEQMPSIPNQQTPAAPAAAPANDAGESAPPIGGGGPAPTSEETKDEETPEKTDEEKEEKPEEEKEEPEKEEK